MPQIYDPVHMSLSNAKVDQYFRPMFLWFPTIISDETAPVQFSNGLNKMKLHFDDRS